MEGMEKFMQETQEITMVPSPKEGKAMKAGDLYGPMPKCRMGAARPWKPKGRK